MAYLHVTSYTCTGSASLLKYGIAPGANLHVQFALPTAVTSLETSQSMHRDRQHSIANMPQFCAVFIAGDLTMACLQAAGLSIHPHRMMCKQSSVCHQLQDVVNNYTYIFLHV